MERETGKTEVRKMYRKDKKSRFKDSHSRAKKSGGYWSSFVIFVQKVGVLLINCKNNLKKQKTRNSVLKVHRKLKNNRIKIILMQ